MEDCMHEQRKTFCSYHLLNLNMPFVVRVNIFSIGNASFQTVFKPYIPSAVRPLSLIKNMVYAYNYSARSTHENEDQLLSYTLAYTVMGQFTYWGFPFSVD
jgi:hypothetical protein